MNINELNTIIKKRAKKIEKKIWERRTHMAGGNVMVSTKADAHSMIEEMSDMDFSVLRDILNSTFEKSNKRLFAEKTFVADVSAAEKSVDEGNYVTLSELHEFLGV